MYGKRCSKHHEIDGKLKVQCRAGAAPAVLLQKATYVEDGELLTFTAIYNRDGS